MKSFKAAQAVKRFFDNRMRVWGGSPDLPTKKNYGVSRQCWKVPPVCETVVSWVQFPPIAPSLVFMESAEKEFSISSSFRCWDEVKVELDKCILVCGNCHDEVHAGVISV